jgi:DNA-binding response OmpR family regulator
MQTALRDAPDARPPIGVVEDELMIRELLGSILEEEYQVICYRRSAPTARQNPTPLCR